MKVTRDYLARLVREELALYARSTLLERSPKAQISTPEDSEEQDIDPASGMPGYENAPLGDTFEVPQDVDSSPEMDDGPPLGDEDLAGDEDGESPDEADDDLDKDPEEMPEEGGIADSINGKTIKSITMDPKSEMMPGAIEIAMEFQEIPDVLRMLVTQSGRIKFHFQGTLHNDLGDVSGFVGDDDEAGEPEDGVDGPPEDKTATSDIEALGGGGGIPQPESDPEMTDEPEQDDGEEMIAVDDDEEDLKNGRPR
jgi:hypothetical protein